MPPAKHGTKVVKAGRALVIAIDFGTTNSGVAYGFTGDSHRPGQVKIGIVRQWPSTVPRNRDLQKVPTRLHYAADGKITWGYEIQDNINTLQWFKLLLMDKATIPGYLSDSTHLHEAQQMLNHMGKDATTVTADYLKLLWNHAITEIKREKGAGLVESTPFHVILTVPAVWPETARNRMRQAAERAGILDNRLVGATSLKFISEPEAAAISILYSDFDDRPGVEKGTRFIVCDCGGGTVDIISYEVVKVRPELKIQECNIGNGGLCGATFLDQAFHKTLIAIIKQPTWDQFNQRLKNQIISDGWEDFIKPEFDGSDKPWDMQLAFGRSITFSKQELRDVFEPIVSQIGDLINAQINGFDKREKDEHAAPEFLFLVGGFGRNKYLYEYLKEKLVVDNIEILQPQGGKPWTAIARGAALSEILQKSLFTPITKRKARQSYGWVVEKVWDPSAHKEGHDAKEYDAVRGEWRALNQFDWPIVAGDDVSSSVVPFRYSLTFPMQQTGLVEYHCDVYKTASANPPARLDRTDISVKKVGELRLEFPIMVERLPVRHNEDEKYRALDFIQFGEIEGNSINFRATYRNETVGEMTLELDSVEPREADDGFFVA
ncbi:uncharacterized protein PG998_011394 [Apiospora kogelbergensis]|uniref:uncharacterized protein n=1 Tax=Apiospora kogelbergensis TaxID=1337665 RepID=UPI00313226E4